jgi:hypothetical protein
VVANRSGKQGGDRRGGHCCCRQALAAEQEQRIAASRLDSAGIRGVVRGRWLTGNEAACCWNSYGWCEATGIDWL